MGDFFEIGVRKPYKIRAEDSEKLLTGMGGIGKSELARTYAVEHRREYDTVILARYESTLEEVIRRDSIEHLVHFGGEGLPPEQYFALAKRKLKECCVEEKVLLILDNLDVDSDTGMQEFLEMGWDVIVTTRYHWEEYEDDCIFVKEFDKAMSVYDIALDLSEGLARAACAGEIDGEVVDIRTVVDKDCQLNILTMKDEKALPVLRHTASHVMAQAVKRLYPGVKLAIGPSISDGFYYDMEFETPLTSDDFGKIEAEMKKIIKENLEIVRMVKAVRMDNKELTAFLKAYASGLITLPENMMAEDGGNQEEPVEMEGYEDEA